MNKSKHKEDELHQFGDSCINDWDLRKSLCDTYHLSLLLISKELGVFLCQRMIKNNLIQRIPQDVNS